MNIHKAKFSSLADVLTKKIGTGYVLKDSEIGGIGLFANRSFSAGDIICPYDGLKKHRSDIKKEDIKTHILSIPNTDYCIDGLEMRKDLKKDKDGFYWPEDLNLYFNGWACMANSSRNLINNESNALIEFLICDEQVRFENYNPLDQTKLSNALMYVLPKKPYLIAKKDIKKNDEILWDYNPQIQKVEIIDLTNI